MSDELKTTPTSLEQLQPGMELQGKVKRIELYGAFVDLGVGKDGLLHISQLGKPNVRNVEDIVKVGESYTVYVMKVDREAGKIALSLVKQPDMSWDDLTVGKTVKGTVTRIEKFGAFVNIGAERDAMIHVSELAEGYVNSPSDVVKVGEEIEAQVIKVNRKQRRIDLSRKALTAPPKVEKYVDDSESDEEVPTALALALRRAMSDSGQELPLPDKPNTKRDKRDKRDKRHRDEDELEDLFDRTLRNNR